MGSHIWHTTSTGVRVGGPIVPTTFQISQLPRFFLTKTSTEPVNCSSWGLRLVPEQLIQNRLLTRGVSEFIRLIKVIRLLNRMCVQSVAVLRSKNIDLKQNIDLAKDRPPRHRYWFGSDTANRWLAHGSAWFGWRPEDLLRGPYL